MNIASITTVLYIVFLERVNLKSFGVNSLNLENVILNLLDIFNA